MNEDDRGTKYDHMEFQAWLQRQRDERAEGVTPTTEYHEGWEREMAATWTAYFNAVASGSVRENERKAFMEFVARVSNPVLLLEGPA